MSVTSSEDPQLDRIRLALRANIAELAAELLGPHNRAASNRFERRWNNHGSFRVGIAGAKRGACSDFETGWMGDPFDLIMREKRCGFPEATEWASSWTGIGLNGSSHHHVGGDKPWEPTEQELERERKRAQLDADAAADRANRLAVAQTAWASRLPMGGTMAATVAERYLTIRRGIPIHDWPDCVGVLLPGTVRWQEDHPDSQPTWHSAPYAGVLVLAATTQTGVLSSVQRVYLNADADNLRRGDGSKIKLTVGPFAALGAAIRLPGSADGPLLLTEGAETGLSLWAATGFETWISMGPIALHHPPAGRRVVVCRDDDRAQSPADKSLTRAISEWRRAGITLTVATPWHVRRGDRSDFNDVLRIGGSVYGAIMVRDRINEAMGPTTTKIIKRRPIADARPAMNAAVDHFFTAATAYDPAAGRPPPVFAIRCDLGSGKSSAARRGALNHLIKRDPDDHRPIVMAVPTHSLGEEAAAEFEAIHEAREAGLTASIWRGRDAPDPLRPGNKMCLDLDRVADAMDAGEDVEKACCRSRAGRCPFFTRCGYQAQKLLDHVPSLWFVAHESLFHSPPAVIGDPATLVVDERMWDSGLIGASGPPRKLSLDSLTGCTLTGFDGQRLTSLRESALIALRAASDGPLARQALLNVGLDEAGAHEAAKLEWRLKVDAKMHPAMTVTERKTAARLAAGNRVVRRLALFWHGIADLLADKGPSHSGWTAMAWSDTKEGPVRVIHLKGRMDIHEDWLVPTLVLDATMDVNLLKPYWRNIDLIADIAITAAHQYVLQVENKTYAKHNFDVTRDDLDEEQVASRTNHLRNLNSAIGAIARAFAPGRTLAVTQLVVSDMLPTVGMLPTTVDHAHHNAVAGIDLWKNHAALIVVGRTAPPPAAVERLAEALTGHAVNSIEGWYPKITTAREMVDADPVSAEADEHPHRMAEAIRWQCCEGELLQIIGRTRGINRTAINSVTIVVMTSTILPIPVTKLLTANDLKPGPIDLQLALGGIAFFNPTHAARAYPELWPTREGAKSAMARSPTSWVQSRIRESVLWDCTQLVANPCSFEYQLAGERQKLATAWYDPGLISDPLSSVMAMLGTVIERWVDQHVEPVPPPEPDLPPDATTPPSDPDPADFYPRAGANDQPLFAIPTDIFVVRTRTGGSVTVRMFDGMPAPIPTIPTAAIQPVRGG